jgi:hypothetical protein
MRSEQQKRDLAMLQHDVEYIAYVLRCHINRGLRGDDLVYEISRLCAYIRILEREEGNL